MKESIIPRNIRDLLSKRKSLAMQLMKTSSQIEEYCKEIGIDISETPSCSRLYPSIYSEPWNAYFNTENTIIKALRERR